MLCVDLVEAWTELRDWLDRAGVLILPRLEANGPTVRLDADLAAARPATRAEVARIMGRLRAVVERFEARAVYVTQTGVDSVPDPDEPASLCVRVVAGGVVHELSLVAAWYAQLPQDASLCLA
jgi:hypothetical protein